MCPSPLVSRYWPKSLEMRADPRSLTNRGRFDKGICSTAASTTWLKSPARMAGRRPQEELLG